MKFSFHMTILYEHKQFFWLFIGYIPQISLLTIDELSIKNLGQDEIFIIYNQMLS